MPNRRFSPPRAVSRPFASASFTITTSPAAWARLRTSEVDRSSKFQVACAASNRPSSSALSTVSAWLRAGDRQAHGKARLLQASQLTYHGLVLQDAAL